VYDSDAQLSLKQIVTEYLSRAHRDAPPDGCAVVALGSEIARSEGEAREVMNAHLKKYFQRLSEVLGDNRELTIPIVCMMNGALTLSRLLDDRVMSDKVLKDTRDFILALAADKMTVQRKQSRRARN
jgi:TetR/AcrR family transcriptional repressor of nem operon